MWTSDWNIVVLILIAAFSAGMINTIVGSGSLFTFPVLVLSGVPPVVANISNNMGLAIGNVAGVWGYRQELRGYWKETVPLIIATVIGSIVGAYLLLRLPTDVFTLVAPVLIAVGCLLVVAQPALVKSTHRGNQQGANGTSVDISGTRKRLAFISTALTGVYGGYFGAAQGVIIVGALGAIIAEPLQRINAIKNVLQTVAGWSASIFFIANAEVHWNLVMIIALGSLVGAQLGAKVGRSIQPWLLRIIIVVVGVAAIVFLAL